MKKLSKQVENTVGKGKIAHYEQFPFFPQCFQKACFPGASKGVIVWEWVNSVPNVEFLDDTKLKAFADNKLSFAKMMISLFDTVENTVGKGKMLVTSIFSFSNHVFQSLVF